MASLRSLAFFVWVFAQVLLISAQSSNSDDCVSFFSISQSNGVIGGIDDIVTVDIGVEELAPVNEALYTLVWDTENVEAPTIEDSDFTKYFNINNDMVNDTWIISVKKDLKGLPDYNPTVQGEIKSPPFDFNNIGTAVSSVCSVTLTHKILDENTQTPLPNVTDDSLTIEEDFMINYPINGFKSVVHDIDGTRPNNEFSVRLDPNCPLEATEASYISGKDPVNVSYQLRRGLDYDTEPGPIKCEVTFQDLGTPSQSSTGTITVNVKNLPDEPPEFTEKYYYTTVESIEVTNMSLTIQPSKILAVDKDTGSQQSQVTYSMTDVQEDVEGMKYFEIDEVTGEVTLKMELDTPFLVNHQQVMFFLTSEDASGANCSAVLTVNLPWKHIVCGGLHFEQAQYVAEIFYQSIEKVVKVTAITNNVDDELEYSLSDGYESKKHFNINSKSGWITINKDNPPPEGPHQLEATASIKAVQSQHTETMVNIFVLPQPTNELFISNSLINPTVEEGEEEMEVATISISNVAAKICIIVAEPLEAHEKFSVTRKDETTWTLRKTGSLDYEEMQEIKMVLEAFKSDTECPEVSNVIPPSLQRSQVMVLINVDDKNDVAPLFDTEDMVVAYPTNEGLRRAVGPVVSVQAKDSDGPEVKYSITGNNADQFTVDEDTGEVFLVKGLDCDPKCEFSVNASDTINSDEMKVTVLPLGMDHIFTLHMDTTVSEVDDQLTQLSQKVGAQICKLYVNPTPSTARTRGRRYKREAGVTIEVQVYSLKDNSLMNLNDLNSALEGATANIQAEKFIDESVFNPPSEDTTDLTAAVAVLGTLLGLVLIAGIAFFAYKKKKGKDSPKPRPPATAISTLGNAYQNHSYEKDGYDTQRSLGHNTKNSLNGFTSVQVHSTQNGDSPPMHKSPLAKPLDSIPLRSIDNQQQTGLRRTNPDTSDYLGSSSSALPSSFTRTTASSSSSSSPAPPPSTSSSSIPIYAEIKKPKDAKPKSTAFPSSSSSSSSSSRPEKNIPRTDFPSNPIDKKPDVPAADYEEVGSSKFSALKSSPPPRRSNRHNSSDDDDDDVKEGVAYPGGKHDSDDEPGEEKKSVAFKVMVDTKEIEPENKGPAQRKAEAEMLMEANRKKLEEENNEDEDEEDDEDEDEEETAKL